MKIIPPDGDPDRDFLNTPAEKLSAHTTPVAAPVLDPLDKTADGGVRRPGR
ncbi:hypothetical protein [Actinacidiphila oryziradicis]|uniref:hypothetical protein n=1 Tax=Actinacidiphila oryziradicis TaxID=2571141 RepID=UPI00145C5FD4|nr:hypothetical protein [Actinacidiphila oryziradicis]